jgi:hypothetical protein
MGVGLSIFSLVDYVSSAGLLRVKGKNVTLEQAMKDQTVTRGTALAVSLTSALDWGGRSTRSGRFTPGKVTWYPLYRRLGGPQGRRSGRVRKISLPAGFDPRTVQPVASRYTDYAIPVHWECVCRSLAMKMMVINVLSTCIYNPQTFHLKRS